MSLRLSFCMIVRNEEANIERCLDSIASVCDEMIVLDTGSTDSTVAIARERGATVYHFDWIDDFSAAYNAVLDKATGDWIFCLDADEWLLPNCQSLVRGLLEEPDVLAYYIQRQEMEVEGQAEGLIEMRHLRLCRNLSSVRCIGYDHPQFADQLEAYAAKHRMRILDSPLVARHSGYLPERKQEKLTRAERLLQKELAERPNQLYYEIELGRTWEQQGDPRGAALLEKALISILAQSKAGKPPTVLAVTVLARCLRTEEPDSQRVQQALKAALRWFPRSPPILNAAASVYFQQGKFSRALPLLEKLADIADSDEYDRVLAFSSQIIGEDAFLNLAVCYHRLADLDRAEHWYHRVLDSRPDHPGALQNLEILQLQRLIP